MKLICLILLFLSTQVIADIELKDLGVDSTTSVSAEDTKKQEILTERHRKLKNHEILGLTTWGMMTATMLTGNSAMSSDLHMYMGITTGALYMATAYYSLTAPKPNDIKDKGRMKWHKGLAWVHFPLMILTPILGYMYKKHEEDNKKHSSLEKQHSAVAGALYGTFTLSAALMVIEW